MHPMVHDKISQQKQHEKTNDRVIEKTSYTLTKQQDTPSIGLESLI